MVLWDTVRRFNCEPDAVPPGQNALRQRDAF